MQAVIRHPSKVILITGAAQRLGAATAKLLHQRGHNIVIHYRSSQEKAESLSQALNQRRAGSAQCVQADLSQHHESIALANHALQCFGRIDVLINNASSFYPTPVGEASEEDWHALIDSNLKGPFFLSQALTDELSCQQGAIINIVDIHSERPMRDHTVYSIAKAGVAMMTKTLAKELAPKIRVNGVSPGAILWPEEGIPEKHATSILSKIPMQRIGEADDIARTVTFLVDDAPYISGQIIAVDGGRSLSM